MAAIASGEVYCHCHFIVLLTLRSEDDDRFKRYAIALRHLNSILSKDAIIAGKSFIEGLRWRSLASFLSIYLVFAELRKINWAFIRGIGKKLYKFT